MKKQGEGAAGAAPAAPATAAAGGAAAAAETAAAAAATAAAAPPEAAAAAVQAGKPEESHLDLDNKKLSKLGQSDAAKAGFAPEDIEAMNTNIANAVATFTDENTREFSPKITKKYIQTILPPPVDSDNRYKEKSVFHSALEKDLTHTLRMQQMQQQVFLANTSANEIIEKDDGTFENENNPNSSRKEHRGQSLFLAAAKTRPAKTFRDPDNRIEITLGHTVGWRLTEKGVFPITLFGGKTVNAKNTVDMKIAIGSLQAALQAGARTPKFGAKDAYKDEEGNRNSPLFDTLSDKSSGLKTKLADAINQYNGAKNDPEKRKEKARGIKQVIEQGAEDLKKELSGKDLQAKRKDIDSFVTLYATSVIQDLKLDAILGENNHAAPTKEELQRAQLETFNLIDDVKEWSTDRNIIALQKAGAVNEIQELMEPYVSKKDQDEDQNEAASVEKKELAAKYDDDDDDEKDEEEEDAAAAAADVDPDAVAAAAGAAAAAADVEPDEQKEATPEENEAKAEAEAIKYQGDNIKLLEKKVTALEHEMETLKGQVSQADASPKVKDLLSKDLLNKAKGRLKETKKTLQKNTAKVKQLEGYIQKIEQEADKAEANAEANAAAKPENRKVHQAKAKTVINFFVHKAKKAMGKSTRTDKMPDLMTQMSNNALKQLNAATNEELVGAYHNSLKNADPATLADDDERELQKQIIIADSTVGEVKGLPSHETIMLDQTQINDARDAVQENLIARAKSKDLPIFDRATEVREISKQQIRQVNLSTKPTYEARKTKHEHMEAIKQEIDQMLVNDADGIPSGEDRIDTLLVSATDRGISSAELNRLIQGADATNWKRHTKERPTDDSQNDPDPRSKLSYEADGNKTLNPDSIGTSIITKLKKATSRNAAPEGKSKPGAGT